MLHSRRSFVGIRSQLEADLTAMVWVAEALCDIKAKRVLLETLMLHWRGAFSPSMLHYTLQPLWRRLRRALDHLEINIITVIHKECNMVATSIATSALQVQWQQFYVANNGSNWLQSLITKEAASTA
ncbi:Uncharacterized protein Rs2_25886 [Raphanus sativus]|nr:Uncharacterized protein Rs2_25886 [Raphanus sativus]